MDGQMIFATYKTFRWEMAHTVLRDIKYAPLEALQKNMVKSLELLRDFCIIERKRKDQTRGEKIGFSKVVNRFEKDKEFWMSYVDRDAFVRAFFNYVLNTEGISNGTPIGRI